LAYLKRLPVDELKIDKAFVRHLATDENDQAIVRSVITLGHQLGLGIVAEGVEDEDALTVLSRLGCDTVQGYYLARPLPPDELRRWLTDSEWGSGELGLAA
jgi:EAL domain-containing protein (putative c-di-GMP-specific phosphodiesterase class I)